MDGEVNHAVSSFREVDDWLVMSLSDGELWLRVDRSTRLPGGRLSATVTAEFGKNQRIVVRGVQFVEGTAAYAMGARLLASLITGEPQPETIKVNSPADRVRLITPSSCEVCGEAVEELLWRNGGTVLPASRRDDDAR